MTRHQMIRRLTKIVAQMESIRKRVDAIVGDSDNEPQDKPSRTSSTTKRKAKKGAKAKRTSSGRLKAIGKVLKYQGGRVKVVERKNGKYYVKALAKIEARGKKIPKGKVFAVGSVWLYKNVA